MMLPQSWDWNIEISWLQLSSVLWQEGNLASTVVEVLRFHEGFKLAMASRRATLSGTTSLIAAFILYAGLTMRPAYANNATLCCLVSFTIEL